MTKQFIATQHVSAMPRDFNGRPGYLVQYPDGYTCWQPTAAFEANHAPVGSIDHLPPKEQAIAVELVRLLEMGKRLDLHLDSAQFTLLSPEERRLLLAQFDAIHRLADIIDERRQLFWREHPFFGLSGYKTERNGPETNQQAAAQ